MEESVYTHISQDKDKTFKQRDLRVEESVYSNITREKDKTFKVRDRWGKSLSTATQLETRTKHSR